MRGIPGIVSLAFSIAVLTSVALGRAEQGTTALAGTVLDSSGDRVAGAKLTLVNSITGISRTAVSGKSGEYLLPDLTVGTYKLKVSYPGFT